MNRNHRPRRIGNPTSSSSSSSSRESTNFRSQKFSSSYRSSNSNSGDVRIATPDITGSSSDALRWRGRGKVSDRQYQQPQREERDEDSGEVSSIVGTCPYMCPDDERDQRERLRDLAVFERLHGNPSKTSPSLAVKKFCRTISTKDVQPLDVRPLPVLEDTLDYLLNLPDSACHPFEVVHDFIFDRTRSIRQDLSMQNIVNDRAISMYEKMVKFHVTSQHKLQNCGSNADISSVHHLNLEQLKKALISLYNLYEANRNSDSMHENEAEFCSFYVLLHLGANSQPMGESLSMWFRRQPSPIIHSKEMCFARRILRLFRLGNYNRLIFTTAAEASYLQYCIVEPYINEFRALAVSCINNGGYKLHPYPLEHLSKLLMMKESDVESFCNKCGLEILTDETGNKSLPTKQTTFCHPNKWSENYSLLGFEQFARGHPNEICPFAPSNS